MISFNRFFRLICVGKVSWILSVSLVTIFIVFYSILLKITRALCCLFSRQIDFIVFSEFFDFNNADTASFVLVSVLSTNLRTSMYMNRILNLISISYLEPSLVTSHTKRVAKRVANGVVNIIHELNTKREMSLADDHNRLALEQVASRARRVYMDNLGRMLALIFLVSSPISQPRFQILKQCGDVETNPGPPVNWRHQSQSLAGAGSNRDGQQSRPDQERQEEPNSKGNRSNGNNKSDLQVMTYNVRGLGDSKKLRHLVNNCYKLMNEAMDSVFMIQESHATHLKLLKFLWRGDFCETPGTGAGKGCLTLLSPMLKAVKTIHYDQRAHIVVIGKSDEKRADLIVVNVYGPNQNNQDKLDFFIRLIEALADLKLEYDCERVIFAGDFNVVFDQSEVKNRSYPLTEKRLARNLKGIFSAADLSDGWHEATNETGVKFTWQSNRSGQQQFSTLDRILYGKSQLSLLTKTVNWSLSISDHAAVIARFSYPVKMARSHITRLDGNLLKDQDAVLIMNNVFRDLFGQRSNSWNPHQTLEFAKMSIRTAVMSSVGQSRLKFRDEEARVNLNINNLVDELSKMPDDHPDRPVAEALLVDQRNVKRDLVNRIGTKLEQRCARRWYNEGELSNKYFFNLLNRKSSDVINKLDINGVEITHPGEIKKEIVDFYRNLYEVTANVPNTATNDLFFSELDQVEPEVAEGVDGRVTLEELTEVLNSCADSAPGPDGIPFSILKHFWGDFGPVLVKAWEYSQVTKQLPPSHEQSYLRLIPKVGKDLSKLSNWRPITLSNTDHKLITKLLSKKLTKVVEKLIGPKQTAYIPGRLINDNIRAMLSTLDIANLENEIDALMISLDAKKAFDSVSHDYIERTLIAFGLGSFVDTFKLLYKNLRSDIIINGEIVKGYRILKGVKQGDALSCILFIMCMEPLMRNIKNNNQIVPIKTKILGDVPKAYSFADDVTVLTINSEQSVQGIFDEYQRLTEASGLTLNAEKTELLRLNKRDRNTTELRIRYGGTECAIKSQECVKINGVLMLQDSEARMRANCMKINAAMEKHLATWSTRNLSLLGKILIIKTYAISQLIFFMQSSQLTESYLKMFEATVFKFLWNKNMSASRAPDRIKREIMLKPVKLGGFGLLSIKELDRAIKLKAYGRFLTTDHPFLTQLRDKSNLTNFFDVKVPKIESVLTEATRLLKVDRLKILNWDRGLQDSNQCLVAAVRGIKVKDILSPAGRQSVAFLLLRARAASGINVQVKDLSQTECNRLSTHIKNKDLLRLVRNSLHLNVPNNSLEQASFFPIKQGHLGDLRKLSTKAIRESGVDLAEQTICIYKIGLILTPGEVYDWTGKIRKLTSVRHRSTLLRIAHGEIYSNSRLFRFGLSTSADCNNCNSDHETILHKILECPTAIIAWEKLYAAKQRLGLKTGPINLDQILGATNEMNEKLSLALNVELLQQIISQGGKKYNPELIVQRTLRSIFINEPINQEHRTKLAICMNV